MIQPEDGLCRNIASLQRNPKLAIPYPQFLDKASPSSPSANWEWLAYSIGYFIGDKAITAGMDAVLAKMSSYARGEGNTDDAHSTLRLWGYLFALWKADFSGDIQREALIREHLRQWIAQWLFSCDKPNQMDKALFAAAGQRYTDPKVPPGWKVEYLFRYGSGMSYAQVEQGAGMKSTGSEMELNQDPFSLRSFLELNGNAIGNLWQAECMNVLNTLRSAGWAAVAEDFILRTTSQDYTYIRFMDGSYLSTQGAKGGIPPTRFLAFYDAVTGRLLQFPDYPEGRSDGGTGGSSIDWANRTVDAWDNDNGKKMPQLSFVQKKVDVVVNQGPSGIKIWNPDATPVPAPSPDPAPAPPQQAKNRGCFSW